jgi:hypothetical protein
MSNVAKNVGHKSKITEGRTCMINISHAFDSSVEGRLYTKDQLTQLCKHVATRRQQHLCATGDTDHTPLHCRQGCGRTVVGVAQLQCFFEVWIQASLTGRLYQYCKTRLRMGAYAIFTRMRQLDTGSDQLAVPQVIKHGCQSHTIQGPEPWKLCYVELSLASLRCQETRLRSPSWLFLVNYRQLGRNRLEVICVFFALLRRNMQSGRPHCATVYDGL